MVYIKCQQFHPRNGKGNSQNKIQGNIAKNIIGILVFPGSKLTAKRQGLELNQYIYG